VEVGPTDPPGDEPGRSPRTRLALLVGVGIGLGLAIGAAIGAWAFDEGDAERHQVGELSCRSSSFSGVAIDGEGAATIDAAFDTLAGVTGISADDWTLAASSVEVVRWERRDGEHLTGVASVHQVDGRWRFDSVRFCRDS
jgi:hypothetical protein